MTGYDISREAAELGEHVRGWRMVLGLTAQQVSERAGITRGTLRDLEQGKPTVGFGTVLQVTRALGVIEPFIGSIDPLRSDLGRARAQLLNRKRAH